MPKILKKMQKTGG